MRPVERKAGVSRPFLERSSLHRGLPVMRERRTAEGEPVLSSFIRSPKDFCAGLIYLAIGLGAIYIGRELPMGTALKMGPAYFPTVLGWLLVVHRPHFADPLVPSARASPFPRSPGSRSC